MAEFKVYDATDLNREEWRELQGIAREGFSSTLDRTQAEIDALVEWGDPEVFYLSHVDPNSQVGKRYNANQSYTKPRVAVATNKGEPVGFAYSAHNVSGETANDRRLKQLTVVKNYLWLREVIVSPDNQRKGIARGLGRALLKDTLPLRKPAAYIWPDEIDFMQGALERVGFKATGEQEVTVFGEGSSPIRQVRMQAKSAGNVLHHL